MPRRQDQESTEERTGGTRYSSRQRERVGEPEYDDAIDDIEALEEDRSDDGVDVYAGINLNDASLQQLHEFAEEFEIDDYEDMNRAELVRAIRSNASGGGDLPDQGRSAH